MAATPKILAQSPVFFASDIERTLAYWDEKVGFRTVGRYGDPLEFAIAERDRSYVMMSQAPTGHTPVPHWRVKDKTVNAYFWVDDAKALFEELTSRGATMDYGPVVQPYNVLEFGIRDPDDHDIAFGQDLTGQP